MMMIIFFLIEYEFWIMLFCNKFDEREKRKKSLDNSFRVL